VIGGGGAFLVVIIISGNKDIVFRIYMASKLVQNTRLHSGDTLAERSVLQTEAIMELTEFFLENHIFSGE
jgi:hypothetical protein